MKKDRFHITNLIKELIINIDNNLTNFPKKEIELKKQIKETAYTMLERHCRNKSITQCEL